MVAYICQRLTITHRKWKACSRKSVTHSWHGQYKSWRGYKVYYEQQVGISVDTPSSVQVSTSNSQRVWLRSCRLGTAREVRNFPIWWSSDHLSKLSASVVYVIACCRSSKVGRVRPLLSPCIYGQFLINCMFNQWWASKGWFFHSERGGGSDSGGIFFCLFWWRQLAAAGRSLNCASCRVGWGERSCPRSVTTIHSVAVDRTPNFSIERRTLYHWATATPIATAAPGGISFQ